MSSVSATGTMSSSNGPAAPAKRKSEDHVPQPRSKRNRYISIACNECKRRKIKCNGQTPCERCGNLSLDCLYAPNCCNNFKDSEEFKKMSTQIATLQEQVEQLFANMNSLRDGHSLSSMGTPFDAPDYLRPLSTIQTPTVPPSSRERSAGYPKHRRFHGPTSIAFNLGVAKTSLRTMGITAAEEPEDDAGNSPEGSPVGTPPSALVPAGQMLHADKDPIWSMDKAKAARLVRFWHEEMGMMYPFMDIEDMVGYSDNLFTFMEAAQRHGLVQGGRPGADAILDPRTTNLKLIIAIGLICETNGRNPLGEKLFSSVQSLVEQTIMRPADVDSICMLVLAAMYHFHVDDEAFAWRLIGIAARHCLELGLHRRETYDTIFQDAKERAGAVKLFWSVYVLDRRWSFGMGMPFVLQEADIDQNLPRPATNTPQEDDNPYLNAMISFSNIASMVWRTIANVDPSQRPINKDELDHFNAEVLNWYHSVPESLKYRHPDPGRGRHLPPRGLHRLQVALYLRRNQMRILIYRPVLHSATSILRYRDYAQTVVDIAKDTIRTLTHVNQTSDLYRTQQMMLNYFLTSALAAVFLAAAHAPAEFSQQCREEFYMALELVRHLSASSYVSKRLWKTIKSLKELGPRLGLNVSNGDTADAHSTAAVAMTSLAGHPVDEMTLYPNGQSSQVGMTHGMQSDLTTLFEAAGGYSTMSFALTTSAELVGGEYATTAMAQQDELARIMGTLF
ncbi:hypothetical protein M011DRAFT_445229 [Sporormia fimetaria CBS 119925]|uniref:Zn(2)-C6 fungal-type domain-containing protein n=1 Tax=Sporormia fimetaria CBS 119925 TaxID=1340428 RepID=A0A6A6V747_9PLEO|nr:hypothetical protein M011DRAFT_445229 [Sporormia fimetaria CBS 119925]